MKKEAIIFLIMIAGSLVSYFVFKTPIWVASVIIALGLLSFVVFAMIKPKK